MPAHHLPRARRAHALLLATAAAVVACGTDGGATAIEPPPPTIGVTTGTDAVTLQPGGTAQATITVVRSGAVGAVTLAAASVPAGVTATFDPAVLSGAASASTLTLGVAASAASGAHTVQVRVSGAGAAPATAAIALTIEPAPSEPAPNEPAPSEPPPSATSLDGIYLGLRVSGVNDKQYQDYWTFLPDGRVLDVDPYEGLDRAVDVAMLCLRYPCGTYVRSGDELRISWAGGPPKVYDVDAAGAFNERGKTQKYRPLDHLNGLRLDATFAEVDTGIGRTMVRLRLTADGRFEEERLMHYTAWAQLGAPGETRVARDGGSGRYTIRRNTLALHYDDGEAAYFTIVVPPGEIGKPVPDVIYVNSGPISRVR